MICSKSFLTKTDAVRSYFRLKQKVRYFGTPSMFKISFRDFAGLILEDDYLRASIQLYCPCTYDSNWRNQLELRTTSRQSGLALNCTDRLTLQDSKPAKYSTGSSCTNISFHESHILSSISPPKPSIDVTPIAATQPFPKPTYQPTKTTTPISTHSGTEYPSQPNFQ